MFLHKIIMDTITCPREEFFVYTDDQECSYRIIKNGGEILLVLDSELEDIDTSWNVDNSKSPFVKYLNQGSDFRVYYSVRNRVFFENLINSNKIVYYFNILLFLLFISLYINNKNFNRYRTGIQSFITDFLIHIRRQDYIEKYGLHSFPINILDKTRTLVEKLVSLVRFSLADDPVDSLSGKIRHFYDLYYLMKDDTCISFVDSDEFKKVFWETLNHDREIFDEPQGWNKKDIEESVLFYKFDQIWSTLKQGYNRELSMLAFSEIPDENKIAENFENLISLIKPG